MNGSVLEDNDEEEDERENENVVTAIRVNMMPPKIRLNRDVIFTLEDLFGGCHFAPLNFYSHHLH